MSQAKTSAPRDTAIDFVKFIALFLVLNSHMGISYGSYSQLATGGSIGDALFFFASGFTLFLGRKTDFVTWYKRRISRIYPSLFAAAIVAAVLGAWSDSFVDVVIAKRYWFIQCILILYPLLFLFKNAVPEQKYRMLLICLALFVMALYPFIRKYQENDLFWGDGYYRWAVFFLFMLLGAIVGKNREAFVQWNFFTAVSATIVCVVLWYAAVLVFSDSILQVLSVIPLMGAAFSVYMIGKSKPVEKLFHSRICGKVLISVGALCLDSYLIQKALITDRFNSIFPLNILLIMLAVILAAYIVKVLSNFISQVFSSEPMNWSGLLKTY